MSTRVITVRASHSAADQAAAAQEAAQAVMKGQLVGFATETVYGIAALASDPEAMRRLRKVKRRPDGPFSLHLAGAKDVERYIREIPPRARWLMSKAWPGPVTILLQTGGKLADAKLRRVKGLYEQMTHDHVIGIRCPDEPIARKMLQAVDGPVVAPSANPSGAPSPRNADDVLHALRGQIDLLVDSGPSRYGKDSSIVRIDRDGWTLLRKGVYDERMLSRFLRKKIGFICTGNTCRSPMAAGLAKKILAEQLDCDVKDLKTKGLEVVSAGIFAANGLSASPEAVQAVKQRGGDISHHKSRKLTADLIKSCDLLFCMTASHRDGARSLAGDAATKICLLDNEAEVPDPIGGGMDVYERTAEHIEHAIRTRIQECVL
ncbi:MAG: threonylcarbamoyl-AMP synthase [Phycisphaerae bacterium]|nr:threonylcarbamoyl-AMP synthase [Phycisphaerae bacterium]